MPIPQEITDVLSQLGLPAGAIALAVGLVRGAGALEKDASEPALKYVSGLLTGGGLSSFGKLGATLVPTIFDSIFGPRLFSYKFISRSFLATTLFWLILIEIKHPNWGNVLQTILDEINTALLIIPIWYIIDFISLIKAKVLLNLITYKRFSFLDTLLFVLLDIIGSYLLIWISAFFIMIVTDYFFGLGNIRDDLPGFIQVFLSGEGITRYFSIDGREITLGDVIMPSTMLTSVWTLLVIVS